MDIHDWNVIAIVNVIVEDNSRIVDSSINNSVIGKDSLVIEIYHYSTFL